jgi:hypothetical protein
MLVLPNQSVFAYLLSLLGRELGGHIGWGGENWDSGRGYGELKIGDRESGLGAGKLGIGDGD